MRSQGRPQISEDDQRRIKRMAAVESSKSEIARTVGVSRPTVYKYAGKIGCTTRGAISGPTYGDDFDDSDDS